MVPKLTKKPYEIKHIFFERFFQFFSIFEFKIHRFWHAFSSHLPSKCQKHETSKIELPSRRKHDFWGFELQKKQKFSTKSYKMKVPKKHRKNHSKNRFREPFWAPKTLPTPPKSKKNRFKIEVEKRCKKKRKKHWKKNPPASDPSRPGAPLPQTPSLINIAFAPNTTSSASKRFPSSTDPLGSGVWEFSLPPSYSPPSTAGRKRNLSMVFDSPPLSHTSQKNGQKFQMAEKSRG